MLDILNLFTFFVHHLIMAHCKVFFNIIFNLTKVVATFLFSLAHFSNDLNKFMLFCIFVCQCYCSILIFLLSTFCALIWLMEHFCFRTKTSGIKCNCMDNQNAINEREKERSSFLLSHINFVVQFMDCIHSRSCALFRFILKCI